MSDPSWLIDKSALVRLGASPDAEQWADRIQRGLVHIAAVTLNSVKAVRNAEQDRNGATPAAPGTLDLARRAERLGRAERP